MALRPASARDSARLLVVRPGHDPLLEDRVVRDLPDLVHPGDELGVNDGKVMPAQLCGRRIGGASEPRIEATLIKRLDGSRWQALVRPARKLKPGDMVRFGEEGQGESSVCFLGQLDATVEAKGEAGEVTFAFAFHGPVLDQAIAERGGMPLPPYIASRRTSDARDRIDYQTMFAREEGAVAAPTAGLHFTERLAGELAARGISFHTVTLHVGAGTFLPVKVDDVAGHKMHAGWGQVTDEVAKALNAARLGARASRPPFLGTAGVSPASSLPKSGRDARAARIVAVGSTSLRLLESAPPDDGAIAPFSGDTSLLITPGYRFRVVDVLLTNFHLPRSTLFMLVAAFCGLDTMKRAYAHAVEKG